MGGCGFLLSVKFATSLLASLAGDNVNVHFSLTCALNIGHSEGEPFNIPPK